MQKYYGVKLLIQPYTSTVEVQKWISKFISYFLMGVIIYPCRGPGTLWHPKVIVIKQLWVWVLWSRAAINEMMWADSLSFANVFHSHTVIRPSSPQMVIPNTTVE